VEIRKGQVIPVVTVGLCRPDGLPIPMEGPTLPRLHLNPNAGPNA
jgi:hypothetical protein